MIAKCIPMKTVFKSRVLRLVEYVTATQDKEHRVSDMFIANCISESADMAALEMLTIQDQNTRAQGDKTFHLLVSFRDGEEPGPETLREVEAALSSALGFGEHQRLAVVHRDTDNLHMHVVINKIHPTKFTMHDPFQAFPALAKACAELEKKMLLQTDNHTPTGKTQGQRQANNMEAMTGQESLLSYAKRECLPAMQKAETWKALHTELAKAGLALSLRGNGMVITDVSGAMIKASDIGRECSKGNLEKRLGQFQPGNMQNQKPEKTYQKKPLGPANPLKEEFQKYRAEVISRQAPAMAAIRDAYQWQFARIQAEDKLARLEAKRFKVGRRKKRQLYQALRDKRQRETQAIRDKAKHSRDQLFKEMPRHTWLSWLQEQAAAGRRDAIQTLRARAFGLAKNPRSTIRGEQELNDPQLLPELAVDNITKRGTVIYRVGDETLRDDGTAFRLSRAATLDTAIMALKLARKRYGDVLDIEGDSSFREKMVQAAAKAKLPIRFKDDAMEKQRLATLRSTPTTWHRQHKKGNELT